MTTQLAIVLALLAASITMLVAYHVASSSLAFCLKRPILLRDRPGQLRRLVEQHGRLFVVTSQRHAAELEAAGPFERVFVGPRRILYVSRPAPPGPTPPPDPGWDAARGAVSCGPRESGLSRHSPARLRPRRRLRARSAGGRSGVQRRAAGR